MLKTVNEQRFWWLISLVVLTSAAIEYLILKLAGPHPEPTYDTAKSLVEAGAFGLAVFLFVFSKFLWKWKLLRQFDVVKYPNMSGYWTGKGYSNTFGTEYQLKCVISQNAWTLCWESWTDNSTNTSIAAEIVQDEAKRLVLSIMYRNDTDRSNLAEHSADHHGACLLILYPPDARSLEEGISVGCRLQGSYRTNKVKGDTSCSTGTFNLIWQQRKVPTTT
jgi:predicted pore-forming effector associated with SMODS systems